MADRWETCACGRRVLSRAAALEDLRAALDQLELSEPSKGHAYCVPVTFADEVRDIARALACGLCEDKP